jgi:hypothetical protein
MTAWICSTCSIRLDVATEGHGCCYIGNWHSAEILGPFFTNIRLTKDGAINELSART